MRTVVSISILLIVISAIAPVRADSHYVARNGQVPSAPFGDWDTAASNIQDAVNAAAINDTVWVGPGRYFASANPSNYFGTTVVVIDKALTLRSSNGVPDDTVIDGEGINRGVAIRNVINNPDPFVVTGFTITNGCATNFGGGIVASHGSGAITVMVQRCTISGNIASNKGGGLYAANSGCDLTVAACAIRGNLATNGAVPTANNLGGGGLYLSCRALITDTVVQANRWAAAAPSSNNGGAGVHLEPGTYTIRNSLLQGNWVSSSTDSGGAIYMFVGPTADPAQATLNLVSCSIVGNPNGTGVYTRRTNCTVNVQNSIVCSNAPYDFSGNCSSIGPGMTFTNLYITYSCTSTSGLKGTLDQTNVTNPPAFVDYAANDFRLSARSPCIHAGTNQAWMLGALDLDGKARVDGNVDIGCYEFPTSGATAVDNDEGAMDVTTNAALLRGALLFTGGAPTSVHVFWGRADGVTNRTAWDHTNNVGVLSSGRFSSPVSRLQPDTLYAYRCCASNAQGLSWAPATAYFTTLPVLPAAIAAPLVIDHRHTDITKLTAAQIARARTVLHIAYGHTSHGSQLTTGMSGLVGFANGGGKGLSLPANAFAWNHGGTGGALDLHDYAMDGDVGCYPDWVNNTRAYLDDPANSNVNVIIWSWCGQMTGKFTGGTLTNEYLAPMTMLETSYPDVVFVYMTGHVDIELDASQKAACQAIRNYCIANRKVLYDFADLDHHDPDGVYYEYVDDNCGVYTGPNTGLHDNWATNWQGRHTLNVDWYDCTSAHSQPLNANQKAYAAWALWCAIAADLDREGIPDEWEERHGGTRRFGAGTSDFDDDAATDWEEYVADTEPTNPASRFTILGVSATNACTLSFLSSTSRVYSLHSSGDPRDGLWAPVDGLTNRPGTGAPMSLTEPNHASNRLYRLSVSLP